MYKLIPLLCFAIIPIQSYSQTKSTCELTEPTTILDVNSITKCSLSNDDETSTKTKKIEVEITSRRRVVRKKDEATGLLTNNHSHKIAGLKKKKSLKHSLDLDKGGMVPFDFVDEIPLFKSCESTPINNQNKCFKQEMTSHIKRFLKYPEKEYDKGIQGRVLAHFAINRDGSIGKINIVSPYKGEALGQEAERIIKKIPNFKPGKHAGKNVIVKYSIPIVFRIPGVKPTNLKKVSKKVVEAQYEFSQLETIPNFKSCKEDANESSMNCFNKALMSHVQNNFAYPLKAIEDNVQGMIHASFIINKKGKIINIETKGPKGTTILERATKLLVEKLPEFSPGIKDGNPVNVKYDFPINFKLD